MICGGAALGASVAWNLLRDGFAGRVVVVERDPSLAQVATALSARHPPAILRGGR